MKHKHINKLPDGHWVRFTRGTRPNCVVEASRFFSANKYGGWAASLKAAIGWRDQYLRTRAPHNRTKAEHLRQKHYAGLRVSNCSGVTGVHPRFRDGEVIGWVATWVEWKGDTRYPRSKRFLAFDDAVRWRKRMIALHTKGSIGKDNDD